MSIDEVLLVVSYYTATTGCHVLYVKFHEGKSLQKKKDALSDLNQHWRDTNANKVVPEYLRTQLKKASLEPAQVA